MDAPKLLIKEEENIESVSLIEYLETTPVAEILENMMPDFPPKYLNTVQEIYANIDLPRGVLNCMIVKVLKEKSGELPSLAYFKKMSETWISSSIFTTSDAIKYSTTFNGETSIDKSKLKINKKKESKYVSGEMEEL